MLMLWLARIFFLPKRTLTSPGHFPGACLWARVSADRVPQAARIRRMTTSCANSATSVTPGSASGFRNIARVMRYVLPLPKMAGITFCCTTRRSVITLPWSTDNCATIAWRKHGLFAIPTPAFSARPNAMCRFTWNGAKPDAYSFATGHDRLSMIPVRALSVSFSYWLWPAVVTR